MKRFWEISKAPLIIGAIAGVLFCVDSLLTHFIWALYGAHDLTRGFMWVAFIAWTVSFGMGNIDRVKMWIGHFVGFLTATAMIYFGQLFDSNVLGIALASLVAVILFNILVMYFDNFKRIWLNSITGIFIAIALVFSGLGVGMNVATWADAGMTLTIILVYSFLGCLCAFCSVYFTKLAKGK